MKWLFHVLFWEMHLQKLSKDVWCLDLEVNKESLHYRERLILLKDTSTLISTSNFKQQLEILHWFILWSTLLHVNSIRLFAYTPHQCILEVYFLQHSETYQQQTEELENLRIFSRFLQYLTSRVLYRLVVTLLLLSTVFPFLPLVRFMCRIKGYSSRLLHYLIRL